VSGEVEARFPGFGIKIAERLGSRAAFVSADANANDGREPEAEFGGFTEDAGGFFRAEMADGVEDPVKGDAQLGFGAEPSAFHAQEKRFEFAAPPVVDNSDGNVNLGMDHSLVGKALGHAPGRQLVVFRSAQVFRNGLEGEEKTGEVCVLKQGLCLRKLEGGGIMADAEIDEGFRRDRPLKMQVKLGLGQTADERKGVH